MKSSIRSNWRPLLRAFYAFLIVIAVLGAMPRKASAQLYVTQMPLYPVSVDGEVNEYDPDTGHAIRLGFIVRLSQPIALAVSEPQNSLFVSNANGKVTNAGFVSKFDASTGAEINRSFITGVFGLGGLAVFRDFLFLVNHAGVPREGAVCLYLIPEGDKFKDIITGLNGALELASNRDSLFVSLALSGSVECWTLTPSLQRKFVISGLPFPQGLAADSGTLYVANDKRVSAFNAQTGSTINPNFITGLGTTRALALWHGNLFVLYNDPAKLNRNIVGKYDAQTGNVIKKDFITGLFTAEAIAAKQ